MLQLLDQVTIIEPLVDDSTLSDYRISNAVKKQLTSLLGDSGYRFNNYTSSAITVAARNNNPANYAVVPNQYFLFACKMHDFATQLYKYFQLFDDIRPYSKQLVGNHLKIENEINKDPTLSSLFNSKSDVTLFAKFLDKDDSSFRLGSKRLINDEGTPRGARDCFGSVILKKINLPDASSNIFGSLVYDLCGNQTVYKSLINDYNKLISTNVTALSLPSDITNLSKPFLLLAGISGTGKTRFVRKQVEDNKDSCLGENYCLTSVRPDWHEPSDILGYTSRLGGDGNAKYITTDVLEFIAKAWRAIIDAGLELEPKGNGLAVTGDKSELNQVLPYWLCLDEMNLAPVEQYFADYLSILETREWQWEDEQFTYCCDSLLKSETIKQLDDKSKLRDALGFADEQYDDAWDLFCEHGLGLPFNLIVAGTVNMDETTHGFSRKVIDRALSFDFGDFFPNEFDHFFEPTVTHNALSYPIDSQASIDKLPPIDSDGNKSINFLKSINKVLNDTPFQLAFRALNELLLAVISTYPEDEKQLQAVWDDFLMCKVLPRIEGDHDKLAIIDDSVNSHEESLLTELTAILKQELVDIWSMEDDQEKLRPDLYRKNIDSSVLYIACRSKAKLTWMQQRLERSGFTSFWP
ncbi:McrB family protein [Psychrobacter sp. AOP30-A2-5]|uniref:McrB family protein n=1 Tax=Psychrobacter sp. AOP30-A2-5 TaxID=3457697 RepID=UPI0040368771